MDLSSLWLQQRPVEFYEMYREETGKEKTPQENRNKTKQTNSWCSLLLAILRLMYSSMRGNLQGVVGERLVSLC